MKLNQIAKWALRQSLGTARGNKAIQALEGPLGVLLDYAAQGQFSAALEQLDAVVAHLREVIG